MKAYRIKRKWNLEEGYYAESNNPLVRWYFYSRFDSALTLSELSWGNIVLDIGTGYGHFLPSLMSHSQKVYAFDIQAERIKKAKNFLNSELGKDWARKVFLFLGDTRNLPFKDHTIDVAFLLDCLEHLSLPVKEACLSEVKRVLRPGGYLICSLPIEKGFPSLLRKVYRKLMGSTQPHEHKNYDYLQDLELIESFFKIIYKTSTPLPFLLRLTQLIKARS